MAEFLTIGEVSRLTGLAPHTLRFYEQRFPTLLNVGRSPGGHRQYRTAHLEALQRILRIVRHEKRSIREAQALLGETPSSHARREGARTGTDAPIASLQHTLTAVLAKLDDLGRRNAHLDALIENLRRQAATPAHDRDPDSSR